MDDSTIRGSKLATMAKVTGTQIRGEIKLRTTKLQALNGAFADTLFMFEGDVKKTPQEQAEQILRLEEELGKYQAAQKFFNVNTTVTFNGRKIILQEAINIVGGYSRVAKLWKEAAGAKKKDKYDRIGGGRDLVRDNTKEAAKATITKDDALKEYERYEKLATDLRTQIGLANNTEVEIEWLTA
jgi:hypothetical protein